MRKNIRKNMIETWVILSGLISFVVSQNPSNAANIISSTHSGCYNFFLASPTHHSTATQSIKPNGNSSPQTSQTRANTQPSKTGNNLVIIPKLDQNHELSRRQEGFLSQQSYQMAPQRLNPPKLRKRFETSTKVDFIASGTGICGPYNTENEVGVCLWSGIDPKSNDPAKMGWMTENSKMNCGKKVWVQRAGQPETLLFAKVLDGCGFNLNDHKSGCSQVFLTKKAFDAMKPTNEELQRGAIMNLVWDFNTEDNMVS